MVSSISLTSLSIADAVEEISALLGEYPLHYGQGMQSSLDEAAYLVSFIAGLPPDFNPLINNRNLTQNNLNDLQNILHKRIFDRTPLAYLLGKTWLSGHEFYVDERVLIPRSPIAEMIENRFTPWWPEREVKRVLDLCTGSGCLGILAAKQFEQAYVDLTDLDAQALRVAKRNIQLHCLVDRVFAIQSDVFQQLPDNQYDIIIANPPYVPQSEQSDLPSEFLREPQHALFAGTDGLDVAKQILKGAARYLDREGILVLEVGQSAFALQSHFSQHNFLWQELEFGGEGVCVLTHQDCLQFDN